MPLFPGPHDAFTTPGTLYLEILVFSQCSVPVQMARKMTVNATHTTFLKFDIRFFKDEGRFGAVL